MRNDRERLLDIFEAIERIEKHTSGGKQDFERSELVQTWVLHHLQIIGQAARDVSADLKAKHQEVEWAKIIGMRNALVHAYFDIDLDITWSVVEKDLPFFKDHIRAMINEPLLGDKPE